MVAIDIHLEKINPERFFNRDVTRALRHILERNIPVALSLPPWMEEYWRKKNSRIIDLVSEIVNRKDSVLGQQGNTHRCKYSHTIADPWHENFCLWGKRLSYNEQREFMEKGREKLFRLTGKNPELYVSPNHQFDSTTLDVAGDMNYTYFADRAIIRGLRPYLNRGLIVIPEEDLSAKEPRAAVVYTHYDEQIIGFETILDTATPLADMIVDSSSPYRNELNIWMKYTRKFMRDVISL